MKVRSAYLSCRVSSEIEDWVFRLMRDPPHQWYESIVKYRICLYSVRGHRTLRRLRLPCSRMGNSALAEPMRNDERVAEPSPVLPACCTGCLVPSLVMNGLWCCFGLTSSGAVVSEEAVLPPLMICFICHLSLHRSLLFVNQAVLSIGA